MLFLVVEEVLYSRNLSSRPANMQGFITELLKWVRQSLLLVGSKIMLFFRAFHYLNLYISFIFQRK